MLYALVIAIAAGLALLGLMAGIAYFGRSAAKGKLSFRGWRWYPNAIGLTVVSLIAAVALWRFFPVFIFIPIIIPFLWRLGRGRSGGGPFIWRWRSGMRRGPSTNGHSNGHHKKENDPSIEGQYRQLDDE